MSGDLRRPLSILIGAVVLVLLIACANIAGLQLARASGKQREVSIQIALGAGRSRLFQQAFVESVLLAVAGALLGLLFANLAIPLLLSVAPESLAANLTVNVDGMVLAYVTAAAVVCAILCGIAPAWHMGVTLTIGLVACTAAFVPARRASSVDPMTALRYE